MDLLRISCAHDLAYVPQYVGIASNYFAELGIDLRLRHGNGTVEDTVGAMERGEADLVLGSCVYGVRLAETGMTPVIVAQSNQQTRHVLAQRTASSADLQWVDLRGKSIVVYPGEAPTAWAAFSYGLTQAGLSLADIKPIIGYTAKDAIDEFIRGVGDLLFIDGEAALRSDLHPALLVCRQTGRLPWSVYMADRTAIGRNEPLFKRFSQGLRSIQRWLRAVDTESIAQAVAPHFTHYSPERLRQVIAFYRSLDLWAGTGDVRSDQLSRWSEGLRLGGLITADKHLTDYIDVL
ncbi:ABC transporter substrate-binding protein (plasmid) [Ensifer adhaerens]|uniref:ABC transporter substrate-binding protein n=1 Tax=Ensifer adhaerens TaxID=106592 RepID=UPI0023A93DA1|nr:ABC transporter substrate-binding protein [Ensifer adhaerens]WDZ81466.1 ABC transporter substrate-binding protein [Ensifer adhaerens]